MKTKDLQKKEQPDAEKSLDYYVSAMDIKAGDNVDKERVPLDDGCFWMRSLPAAQ